MASKIDIANLSLGRIGRDETISSFDESSKAARKCKQFYDQCQNEVLARYPWAFAQRIQALAPMPLTDTLIPGWGFAYEQPADALGITAIVPNDYVGEAINFFACCDGPWNPQAYKRGVQYRKALSDDQTGIIYLTNVENAWAVYTVKVENTEIFPPLMVSMIADRLGMELAMPMTADPRWYQYMQQRYTLSSMDASSRELEQESKEQRPTPRAVMARR